MQKSSIVVNSPAVSAKIVCVRRSQSCWFLHHFADLELDPAFHINADPDPTFHFSPYPDPAPHQRDENLLRAPLWASVLPLWASMLPLWDSMPPFWASMPPLWPPCLYCEPPCFHVNFHASIVSFRASIVSLHASIVTSMPLLWASMLPCELPCFHCEPPCFHCEPPCSIVSLHASIVSLYASIVSLYASIVRLNASVVSIYGLPPTAQLWAGKLPNFDLNADPDPDLASQNNVIWIRQCSGTVMICCNSGSGCRQCLEQFSQNNFILGKSCLFNSKSIFPRKLTSHFLIFWLSFITIYVGLGSKSGFVPLRQKVMVPVVPVPAQQHRDQQPCLYRRWTK